MSELPYIKIWSRRSEWDYSWLASIPAEARLCRIYEYARYALLLLDPKVVFPQSLPPGALPHLFAARKSIGPIFFLGCFCPTNFPQTPYRHARSHWKFEPDILFSLGLGRPCFFDPEGCLLLTRWTFDPEMLVAMIEWYSDPLTERTRSFIGPKEPATAKQLSEKLLAQLPAQARPKRGAGARIRQDKTDLNCLGALKLLSIMSAPEAINHTEKALSRPLFSNESEWSRGKRRALRNLAPYQIEAEALFRAFNEKRKLTSFSYLEGKTDVEWG
jgi:hypothetical protein